MIKLIGCRSGDWVVILVDGEMYYEGHDIPYHVWIDLINEVFRNSSHQIVSREISDEDMEEGNYGKKQ